MRKILLLNIFTYLFVLPITAFAGNDQDLATQDSFYNDLLERHESAGQMSQAGLQKQKHNYNKGKAWQKKFNNQVRGVASSLLGTPRKIIQLNNEVIEISVK